MGQQSSSLQGRMKLIRRTCDGMKLVNVFNHECGGVFPSIMMVAMATGINIAADGDDAVATTGADDEVPTIPNDDATAMTVADGDDAIAMTGADDDVPTIPNNGATAMTVADGDDAVAMTGADDDVPTIPNDDATATTVADGDDAIAMTGADDDDVTVMFGTAGTTVADRDMMTNGSDKGDNGEHANNTSAMIMSGNNMITNEGDDDGNNCSLMTTGADADVRMREKTINTVVIPTMPNDSMTPKSFILPLFLDHNPGLRKEIVNFFDELFMNGFQEPWTVGQKVIVSLDAAYFRHLQASVDRNGYVRQNFSREEEQIWTNNKDTVFRYSYGTGSGLITHGIPKCHSVFRAFPDSLECIAKSVEAYLQQNVNDETIIIKPFTTAVIATYLDDKKIQEHCDQRWSAKGEFMENQNSQEEGTATVILVIGADRTLDFAMYWYNGIEQVGVGIKGRYQLKHGSLFILDPSNEKPMKRNSLERYGYTFYKHSSNGVKGRELEMSIGIVFWTTNHLVEVYGDTGLVVLDEKLEMNMIQINKESKMMKIPKISRSKEQVKEGKKMLAQRNKMLEIYMNGQVHRKNKRGKQNQRAKMRITSKICGLSAGIHIFQNAVWLIDFTLT